MKKILSTLACFLLAGSAFGQHIIPDDPPIGYTGWSTTDCVLDVPAGSQLGASDTLLCQYRTTQTPPTPYRSPEVVIGQSLNLIYEGTIVEYWTWNPLDDRKIAIAGFALPLVANSGYRELGFPCIPHAGAFQHAGLTKWAVEQGTWQFGSSDFDKGRVGGDANCDSSQFEIRILKDRDLANHPIWRSRIFLPDEDDPNEDEPIVIAEGSPPPASDGAQAQQDFPNIYIDLGTNCDVQDVIDAVQGDIGHAINSYFATHTRDQGFADPLGYAQGERYGVIYRCQQGGTVMYNVLKFDIRPDLMDYPAFTPSLGGWTTAQVGSVQVQQQNPPGVVSAIWTFEGCVTCDCTQWDVSHSASGADLYEVYHGPSAAGPWQLYSSAPISSQSVIVGPSGRYLKVRAVNSAGFSESAPVFKTGSYCNSCGGGGVEF